MTADVKLLPLPEMDIYTLGSGVGLRDVRHTPVGFSQKKMSEYARANVSRTIAAKNAELVELRSAIEELRAEVDCANGWNERVSVCRDHVADIVDGPCVICALNAAKARAQQPAAVDGARGVVDVYTMQTIADAAAALDKRGDRQMAARLIRLHTRLLAAQRQEPACTAAGDARDAERYRWLRKALLGAEDDPIDHLLLEKEPETEVEFDAAVDAAIATQNQEPKS